MASNTAKKEVTGLHRITKKRLLELCKKNKLYQTPSLNDVLYLHYQGFQYIECLEEYTELKCLWLECNAISEIQGLENQSKLKCLFLQSNLIKRIENLQHCVDLDTLNLSSNHITKIENCGSDVLPLLSTLNLSSNLLKDSTALTELEQCKNVSVLDLSNNRIDDVLVVKVFAKMPQLRVLVLQGNPVVSKLPQYRKTLILECKELTYLDSRPVFDKDRACAEAWKRGGYNEERKENERWNRKERKKIRDSVNATIRLRNRHLSNEEQVSLLNSSDSDREESDVTTRHEQTEAEADDNEEMCTWDEIEGDTSSTSSSEENESSSTSVEHNSLTTDSNGCESVVEPKLNDDADIVNNAEEKANDEPQEQLNMVELMAANNSENYNDDDGTSSHSDDTYEDDDINDYVLEKSKGVLDLTREDYNKTVDAICKVSMNDLSRESTPKHEHAVQLQIEVLDSTTDAYEPEKEIDDIIKLMDESSGQSAADKQNAVEAGDVKEISLIATKSTEQLEYERQSDEINAQMVQNFEALSSNMDIKIVELQKDMEACCGEEKIGYQMEDKQSDSSSESELNEMETVDVERSLEQWNKNFLLKSRERRNEGAMMANNSDTSFKYTLQQMITERIQEQNDRQKADYDVSEGGDRGGGDAEMIRSNAEQFPYTVPSQELIAIYEKETNELKALLERLEKDNERLYNLNNTYRQILENDIRDEIKYQDKESNECAEKLCECIIEDVLAELELQEQQQERLQMEKPRKPKSYEFPEDLEIDESDGDEAANIPTDEMAAPPKRTIRQVITSFNEFMDEVTRKNREAVERRMEERKRIVSTQQQKAEGLQMLLESPYLQEFNADTNENLDARLEAMKQEELQGVQKLVDRVYAQRDKYDDSLEVVDGRLVVVKKDSGEIEELPCCSKASLNKEHDDSDKDTDDDVYNTAPSQYEDDDAVDRWNMHTNMQTTWTGIKPYKPSERKTSEELIHLAMGQHYANQTEAASGAESDAYDADDEYHSMETTSSTLFGEIEEQMLNQLNFEQLRIDGDLDEHHIVQCARSYDELKHLLRSKESAVAPSNLTTEEKKLLEQMLAERASKNEQKPSVEALTSTEDEEDLLLRKMVERTKREQLEIKHHRDLGAKEAEEPQQKGIEELKLCSGEEMIVLYKYEGCRDSGDGADSGDCDILESKDQFEEMEKQKLPLRSPAINKKNALNDEGDGGNEGSDGNCSDTNEKIDFYMNASDVADALEATNNNEVAEQTTPVTMTNDDTVENINDGINNINDNNVAHDEEVTAERIQSAQARDKVIECSVHVYNYDNGQLNELTVNAELIDDDDNEDDEDVGGY